MDCFSCEDLLSALQPGSHPPETRAAIENHLAGCKPCRRFAQLLENESETLGRTEGEQLTSAILERTTGLVCDRAKAILPDWIDGVLARVDAEILTVHLRHCPGCASLAEVLAELRTCLPELALLEPGRAFTDSVLERTTRCAAGRRTRADRMRTLWTRLAQRPRISLEAAYAGTLIFVLLMGTPAMPSLDASTTGIARLSGELGQRIDSLSPVIPDGLIKSPGAMLRTQIRGAFDVANVREALAKPAAAWVMRAQLRVDAAADRIGETTRRLLSTMQRIREDMRAGRPESPS